MTYYLRKPICCTSNLQALGWNKEFSGIARLVEEKELSQKISNIKYTEESRQKEARIVLEIKLIKND